MRVAFTFISLSLTPTFLLPSLARTLQSCCDFNSDRSSFSRRRLPPSLSLSACEIRFSLSHSSLNLDTVLLLPFLSNPHNLTINNCVSPKDQRSTSQFQQFTLPIYTDKLKWLCSVCAAIKTLKVWEFVFSYNVVWLFFPLWPDRCLNWCDRKHPDHAKYKRMCASWCGGCCT